MKKIIGLSILFSVLAVACKKDTGGNSSGPEVRFSVDSLMFDTLFTTTGSVTKQFKIYNRNKRPALISEIWLTGNEDSYFHMVVDGRPGRALKNLEVGAHDSIYIFVSVNIDPSEANLPFIVRDTVNILVDDQTHHVPLSAWGQNARFLHSAIVAADTNWTDELPIVITGGVFVAKGATLQIKQGTRVYLHADAPVIVDGRLIATGTQGDSGKVIFQGDRLEKYYRDLPGSWPGIFFTNESSGSRLEDVVIRNAYQGIAAEGSSVPGEEKITLNRSLIYNCYDVGVIALNSSITAMNSIIYNCGRNIILLRGGRYNFVHCTVAATGNAYVPHKQPVLTVTDFTKEQNVFSFAATEASFVNCIFWGNNGAVEDEVVVSREGGEPFDVNFWSCLWKIKKHPGAVSTTDMIDNEDPLFTKTSNEINDFNLQPREGSPVIGKGTAAGIDSDYLGRQRVNAPDIGALESTF